VNEAPVAPQSGTPTKPAGANRLPYRVPIPRHMAGLLFCRGVEPGTVVNRAPVEPESRAPTKPAGANRLPYRVHPQPKNPFLNPSAMPSPPKNPLRRTQK